MRRLLALRQRPPSTSETGPKPPISEVDILCAALLSTDEDLFVDASNGRLVVTGKTLSGERLEFGDISMTALLQAPNPRALIDHIRFVRRR